MFLVDLPNHLTGDKGSFAHQVHAEHIVITGKKVTAISPAGAGWIHFKCPLLWVHNSPGPKHAEYISNVADLSNVFGLGPKCVKSVDWVH